MAEHQGKLHRETAVNQRSTLPCPESVGASVGFSSVGVFQLPYTLAERLRRRRDHLPVFLARH
jgi:hypothetical protein